MNVGIYIYDNAEVLDFSGPYEVFSTANRLSGKAQFNTFLVAENTGQITARAGYRVIPHYNFASAPVIDVLIVVGGVHNEELNKPKVIDWIRKQSLSCQITASVCTGAFLLAKAGCIDDLTVTTHWEDTSELRSMFPQLKVIEQVRWVDEGSVVTSAGISAGIDMSLHLVEKLTNRSLAKRTARQMDFDWTENSK